MSKAKNKIKLLMKNSGVVVKVNIELKRCNETFHI